MFNYTDDEDHLDLDFDDNSEGNSAESSDDDISIVVTQSDNRRKRTTFSKVKSKTSLEQDSSDFEDEMEHELSQNIESLKRHFSSSQSQQPLPAVSNEPTTTSTTSIASTSGGGGGENNDKFYNDIYFDSDEEDNGNENKSKNNDNNHRVMSNDELFYDPTMDAKDQLWMDERRRNPHKKIVKFMTPPGSKIKTTKTDRTKLTPKTKKGTGGKSVRFNLADGGGKLPKNKSSKIPKRPTSDALLDCPACMTTICVDCQRHDRYPNQYRAMFVMNCSVDYSENLTYPNSSKNSKKMKQSSENPNEVYHPVYCNECRTQVAVYDEDEIYHFFNIISSYA